MEPRLLQRFGDADVFVLDLARDDDDLALLHGFLDDAERAHASRLTHPRVRRRFVAGRGSLRWLLGLRLGVPPRSVALRVAAGGKPTVDGIEFNLSHSGDVGVCVIATGRRVGVDVEGSREIPEALELADRWLAPDERSRVLAASPADRSATFLRMWTRREAYAKALGVGIADGTVPENVDPSSWEVHDLGLPSGWVGTVVLERPPGFPCAPSPRQDVDRK